MGRKPKGTRFETGQTIAGLLILSVTEPIRVLYPKGTSYAHNPTS